MQDINPYSKDQTPLLWKYAQQLVEDFKDRCAELVIESKEKQRLYEELRFLYRQDHHNLSNQVMGIGKSLNGIR